MFFWGRFGKLEREFYASLGGGEVFLRRERGGIFRARMEKRKAPGVRRKR